MMTWYLPSRRPHRMRRILSCLILTTALFSLPLRVCAEQEQSPKDEIVYVKLQETGAVGETYVVNRFPLNQVQSYTDYGPYDSVLALSPSQSFAQNGNQIQFQAGPGTFFYQGTLKQPMLPWKFTLHCRLNGKEIPYHELAKQSGTLELSLEVEPNADKKLAHFVEEFLLQGMVTLHADSLQEVEAPQGITAFEGAKLQVAFFVFPGRKQTCTIRAQGKNWTPEAIQWSALPYSLDPGVDLPNAQALAQQFAPLSDGISQLSSGMQALHLGLTQAEQGSAQLHSGMMRLQHAGASLQTGAQQLSEGLYTLSYGASAFGDGLHQAQLGSQTLAQGLQQLDQKLSSALSNPAWENGSQLLEQWQKQLEALLPQLPNLDPKRLQEFRAWLLGHPELLKTFQKQIQEWKELLEQIQKGLSLPSMPSDLDPAKLEARFAEQARARESVRAALESLEESLRERQVHGEGATNASAATGEEVSSPTAAASSSEVSENSLTALQALRAALSQEEQLQEGWQTALLHSARTWKDQQESLQNQLQSLRSSLQEPDWAAMRSWSESWIPFLDSMQTWLETGEGLEEWIAQLQQLRSALPSLLEEAKHWLTQFQELQMGVRQLAQGGSQLSEGLGALDRNFHALQSGILQAAQGSQSLHKGIQQYCFGVQEAAKGSESLQSGLSALVQGSQPLNQGLMALDQQTKNLAPQIEKQIEAFTKGMLPIPYHPQSFVSDKNPSVHSVQFVFLIQPEIPPAAPTPVPEAQSQTLWQKFLDLFRKKGS